MKGRKFFLTLLGLMVLPGLFAGASAQQYSPPRMRTIRNLNRDWQFIRQDVAVSQAVASSDPSNWSDINLPHSFDIPYWRAGSAKTPAIGWYRKHLVLDKAVIDAKKRVFIDFEAAFQLAAVYVNGTLAGTHAGGYTGFVFDITSQVKSGDNVIAVRLDARWSDTIAPNSGEHIFIGGIYRNVSLLITDPLHVAWYGTFVSTPQVSAASATVRMKTEVKNDGTAAAGCRVKTVIVDATGSEVTSFESSQTIAAGATVTFDKTGGPIANPHLWSPSTPYLYKAYTEVYSGESLVDNFESPLGIRWFKWTMDNGFVLNGERLWLQGANVHQDHAGWGDACTDAGSVRDVGLIKECGMNFIRGSHYPHAPAFSEACDSIGICQWSESTFWACLNNNRDWLRGGYSDNDGFRRSCVAQTREMIRIHRNHPSIIAWSMGNELWFSPIDKAVALLTDMVKAAHEEDATRPAGVGGVQLNTAELSGPCDIVGFNGGFLTGNAGIPSMVSEYGSCEDGGENYNGCYGDNLNDPPSPSTYGWESWRAGIAHWCGFWHGSILQDSYGKMGMINHARLPQKRWYYYRNLYRQIPPPVWPTNGTAAKLKLTTDRDTITDDGRSNALLIVEVQDASGKWLANSPDITLTDLSGLGEFPTGSSLTFEGGAWDKGVRNGKASIEFRSYNDGNITVRATSGNLASDSVKITVLHVSEEIATGSYLAPAVMKLGTRPQERVVKSAGTIIRIPDVPAGKKVMVSIFDMQGRLIGSSIQKGSFFKRPEGARGIALVKVRSVKE